MDVETLTNYIENLSKVRFDSLCKIIINDIFHKVAINVDGKGDGGADIVELDDNGRRTSVVYQLTVQKDAVPQKMANDVRKAISVIKPSTFYFMTTSPWSESKCRMLEAELRDELDIACCCYGAKAIANLLIGNKLINVFLENSKLYIPHDIRNQELDYRERMLHSCIVNATYRNIVDILDPYKGIFLYNHDVWALQYLSDRTTQVQHWIMLTYDRTLLEFGKNEKCDFWESTPEKILSFISSTQNLSETSQEDLLHFVATSSEQTLAVGARMIDKILEYISGSMQNLEFKQDFYQYKKECLLSDCVKNNKNIDKVATDLVRKFLKSKGIEDA